MNRSSLLLVILATLCCSLIWAAPNPPTKSSEYNLSFNHFRWVDDDVGIALTLDYKVWRTENTGVSWVDITNKLQGAGAGNRPVFLYEHETDPSLFYIRGESGTSWTSINKGKTWDAVKHDKRYMHFNWHPSEGKWALAFVYTDLAQGKGDLYVTKDFASTFTLVYSNVWEMQFEWGDAGTNNVPKDRIYMIADGNGFRNFIQTDDYGKTIEMLVPNAYSFLFLDHQVFVLEYLHKQGESVLKVTPHLGRIGKKFYEAQFPSGSEISSAELFTILDDYTGAVYVGVSHAKNQWGNLYVSDSMGVKYIPSVPHVALSVLDASYDFDRILGLEGVYLANTMHNWETVNGKKFNEKLKTLITMNNGATWKPLIAPSRDSSNLPYPCTGDCSLQLHGWTSLRHDFGPFYSTTNAVGLIIANGNVGEYLSFDRSATSTFLSRDGGLTWKELMRGPTIYEIGDHGAIIVIAPLGIATTKIFYTLDEGATGIKEFTISNTPLEVDNIITEASSTSTRFVVLGTRNGAGVVISLDFSAVYSRECAKDDYESWAPSTGTKVEGLSCLMGRQVTYSRRKQNAECKNDEDVDHVLSVKNCKCIEDDWECDFGYERSNKNDPTSQCKLSGAEPTYPPPDCVEDYNITKGYRKEAANTCEGGVDHTPAGPYACPGTTPTKPGHKSKGWVAAVILVPLILIAIAGGIFALRSEKIREKIPFISFFSNMRDGYSGVSTRPGTLFDDEEDYIVGQLDRELEDEESSRNDGLNTIDLNAPNTAALNAALDEDFDPRR